MTEQGRFPERKADPLSDIPRRTPIIVEGHSAGYDHTVWEVLPTDVTITSASSDEEPRIFPSRTGSSTFVGAAEYQESLTEPSPQTDQSISSGKFKSLRTVPYTYVISVGTVALLAVFYLFVYTPFIRVAWIESLEGLGQSAPYAAQKCAILDMEDSIFRDGSLHPKLVRFGCTMVEPRRLEDRDSQSKQMRRGAKPNWNIPDLGPNTDREFRLWSLL